MVFHRQNDNSSRVNVVDGQQRLTTVTVFFCLIRDIFLEHGEKNLAAGIQNFIEKRDVNNELTFTLISQDPYPFFQDHIQKLGNPELKPAMGEAEKALKNCYDYLKECIDLHIDGMNKKKAIKDLCSLRDKALSIKVITVELDNEDDAYYIFETLNTRGKELGVSDLTKNHVLRFLRSGNAIDTTREKWNNIQKTIGHANFDISMNSFITHHWISKYEYLTERKLFQSMRKELRSKADVKSYFDNICEEASLYRSIFEPKFHSWTKEQKDIPNSLKAFPIFRLRQAAPFALSILSEHNSGNISTKNAATFLKAIENFHFKFTAITSQRGAGGIAKMYSRAARDLRTAATETDKRKICLDMISRFREMQPELLEFQLGFQELLFSKEYTNQRTLVRYVLEMLHRHHNSNSSIDYEQMTIEHIMPQSANHPEETKASIGNLVFIHRELNEKLKNKSFKDKKEILIRSGQIYDETIIKAEKWDEEKIMRRTEHLSKLAYDAVWKI